MGMRKTLKLRYCEQLSLGNGGTGVQDYVYSANGLYDPNITGTGHQPYGFDQIMPFYNHYTVIGSVCKVYCANNQDIPIGVGVALRDDATTFNDIETSVILEQPGVNFMHYGVRNGQPAKALIKTFSARKFFGRPPLLDSIYRGTASANPNEQAYFHVMIMPNIPGDTITGQVLIVCIEYIAIFHEPNEIPAS